MSRQEVYYFGVPNDKASEYDLNSMPCWLDLNADNPSYYGIPFHLNKGFKIAYDERSTVFDPDKSDRIPIPELVERTKSYFYHRFPKLNGLPIVETRVCQYENSLDGNFIINYHKKNNNVLVLSGSSGHGFKLGPGLGEIIGPNGNFSQLTDFSKWILSISMILGRLELFAVLVLFIPSFWRKY